MRSPFLLCGLLISVLYSGTAQAAEPQCAPSPSHEAVRIPGMGQELPFVAGDRNFYHTLDNGWVFALMRAENGWLVRLYDREPIGDAVDLTSLTPPLRGAPNPRDIFGWHFRNADNTGPNEGDVNAPQSLRAFVISPSLAGTGGFKPSGGQNFAPSPDDGIGWLKVVDFGLANPKPGVPARMNYLQFDACLSWPRPPAERDRLIDLASVEFTVEDREVFGACGLDLDSYELTAPFAPRQLSADFDNDEALDVVARVRRKADGKQGLALCRAGTWLDILGYEKLGDLRPEYIDQLESWTWFSRDGDIPRQLTGFDLPVAGGPLILLERIEKEAILLFRREGEWHATQIYRYVEP